eukprot:m.109574 g.109574  ORF g.109574 m.109574 type:complete len:362 (-) comp22689_c0_seq1:286-1371(-)
MEKTPLFMTKAPTPEEIANNPDLQALQALVHQDSTPEEQAEYDKTHANEAFKKAQKAPNKKVEKAFLLEAAKLYQEALDKKCDDKELNSVIHSNMAAVHLKLRNFGSVLKQCAAACQLNRRNLKAYYRAACACKNLNRFDEGISWCDRGLVCDHTNKALANERAAIKKLQAAELKNQRKEERKQKKIKETEDALLLAIQARGVRLQDTTPKKSTSTDDSDSDTEDESDFVQKNNPTGATVHLDADGHLHWPVLFVYPEHQQVEFIADFHENSCFADHLRVMFPGTDLIPWDADKKYRHDKLNVYFESKPAKGEPKLIHLPATTMLREAVSHPDYVVEARSPSFMLLVDQSPFEQQFKAKYS